MIGETVQLMVLPSAGEGLPQVLIDDGGIWRDTLQTTVGAVQPEVLRRDIERHLGQVMARVAGPPPDAMPAERAGLWNPFSVAYQAVLPSEVRELLKAAAADSAPGTFPLLKVYLAPAADWIPWELLHDGSGFLGLRFAVCRLPIVKQRTEVRGPKQREVKSVVSLLGKGILQNGSMAVWESTFQPHEKRAGWEHRHPPAGGAAAFPTLDQIAAAKDADILHVTCHGGQRDDPGGDLFWTLDHQAAFTPDYRITEQVASSAQLCRRPLVFGNACASIVAGPADRGTLHGFGASFMLGGALNFVGTAAPITDDTAVNFAARFYQKLFGTGGGAGMPIAEALLATKRSFADVNHPDPSYLFYSLYGPPDITYVPI